MPPADRFSPPRPRGAIVSRGDVIASAVAGGYPLVAVTAPAGYGKSTLLAEWARREDRDVAWLRLDRADDDPATLMTALASTCCQAGLCGRDVVVDLTGGETSAVAQAAATLTAALRTRRLPFVVMLDDLHLLQARAGHEVLGRLLSAIPRGSQLVTASRCEPGWLPGLRVSGNVFELGPESLAFDAANVRQVLHEAKVGAPGDLAHALVERTEGWPVGIRLATLVAGKDPAQARAVTGEDPYVADYLGEEVLSRQPRSIQRFLRRTAVLEELTGPLCEAVLGTATAPLQLHKVETENLFVIPLDRRRHRYRYHRLFREFLLGELHRTEPGIVLTLHERAADWYQSHGQLEAALGHLLHTPHLSRAGRLVTELAPRAFGAGQLPALRRWLDELGDIHIEQSPPLAVVAGWAAALTGDPAQATRWARFVDGLSSSTAPVDGAASFDSARAMLRAAMCAGGPAQMMADATLALDQEPEWSPFHVVALGLSAEAALLAGRRDQARSGFAEASSRLTAEASPASAVLCASELALLAMDRGDWPDAAGQLKRAHRLMREGRLPTFSLTVLAIAAAARWAAHSGDLKEARRQLEEAMRERPSVTYALPHLAVRLRLQLAMVSLSVGDPATAHRLLDEVDGIGAHRSALGSLTDEVDRLRDTLAGSNGVEVTGALPLSPAELRLLPLLQTHLTVDQIAQRLFLSSHTVKTEVKAIYRKLGVSTRNDAVHRATTIGLLGRSH